PADRPGLATVLGPEGEQACLEVLQVVRHGRRQQLALDDAEEDLDLVQPGGVDGGVDQDQVRVALAEPAGWLGTLVGGARGPDPKAAGRRGVGLHGNHLVHEPGEGRDPGLGLAAAQWEAARDVPGTEVLESAPTLVVALPPARLTRARRGQLAPAGLDRGLL